jgi:hypothetical protein
MFRGNKFIFSEMKHIFLNQNLLLYGHHLMAVVATSTFPMSGTSRRTAAAAATVASCIARVRSAGDKLRARRGLQDA